MFQRILLSSFGNQLDFFRHRFYAVVSSNPFGPSFRLCEPKNACSSDESVRSFCAQTKSFVHRFCDTKRFGCVSTDSVSGRNNIARNESVPGLANLERSSESVPHLFRIHRFVDVIRTA
jgi:hypothetical protein